MAYGCTGGAASVAKLHDQYRAARSEHLFCARHLRLVSLVVAFLISVIVALDMTDRSASTDQERSDSGVTRRIVGTVYGS